MDLGPSNPLGLVVLATCLSFALGEELIGCFEEAECIGATSTGIAQALNANECYDLCHNLPNCNFFTFYTDDSFCFTYSNCPKINSDCDNCISGMNH